MMEIGVKTKSSGNLTPAKKRLKTQPNCNTTPLRRKSLAVNLPRITPGVENDDEAERNKRRSEEEQRRRISTINSPALNSSINNSDLAGGNLQDHFDTCLRMFTHNKINIKNVWSLNIIDYLRSIVHQNGELRNMLQVAGTSLDIGAKIYSLRVDDVHQETLKLANTLTRINLNDGPQETTNDSENEENMDCEESTPAEQTKKKKKQRNLNTEARLTICEQDDNLNAPVTKHPSLFRQCSDSTDSSSLLNISLLRGTGASYELLVRARSKQCNWQISEREINIRDGPDHAKDIIEALPSSSLCPAFNGFAIDKWDVNEEDDLEKMHDEVMFDADGIPIPDLDTENHDPNALDSQDETDDDFISEEIEFGAEAHHGPVGTAFITDMCPTAEQTHGQTLEYSYRPIPSVSDRFNLEGVWAGPAHWKMKFLRKSTNNVNNVAMQEKAKFKKPKNVPQPLVFEDISKEEVQNELAISKKKMIKNTLILCLDDNTLPEDMHIQREFWLDIGILPHIKAKKFVLPSENDNLQVSGYAYDNPIDNEYCNQTVNDDHWDNEDGPHGAEDMPTQANHSGASNHSIGEDDLIDAPDLVPHNFLAYAQKAKKMDMKKLKAAMWEELVEDKTTVEGAESAMEVEEKVKSSTLKTIYDKIPGKVSESMAENLSCPLAFVALLHLANEHMLLLEGTEDLKDVIISKP